MHEQSSISCPKCGNPAAANELVCANCGGLVHLPQLNQITAEALQLERVNPAAATMAWRGALDLLPPESPEYAKVVERMRLLTAGWSPVPQTSASQYGWPTAAPQPAYLRPQSDWRSALLKTGASMLISILVYYLFSPSLLFAGGFVVLMLIHEMGHVLATWYYGLSASPPVFIPFVGAIINLWQSPPNALVESVVGIAGPVLGTVGAVLCYALATIMPGWMGQELMKVAFVGFFLNLFNLLPVPPLDGGRVTAAISPWLWIAGLGGLAALIMWEARIGAMFGVFLLILVLFYALPRIRATLRSRWADLPYYRISRTASWSMTVVYVALGLFLGFMFNHLGGFRALGV